MQSTFGDNAAAIKRVACPTLVLWGAKDLLIPVTAAHQFHADIHGSSLVILDELGHIPQEEDPDGSLEPVLEFLKCKNL